MFVETKRILMGDLKREEIKKYADLILKELSSENSLMLDTFEERNPFISKYNTTIYDVVDYLKMLGYVTFRQTHDEEAFQDKNGNWVQPGNFLEIIEITESGIRVKENGGIIKSENAIRCEKLRKKWHDIIGIWGGIAGLLSALFGVLIYFGIIPLNFQLDETTIKLDSIKNEIQSIEDKKKALDKEYVKHIDSLYNEINKLKKSK